MTTVVNFIVASGVTFLVAATVQEMPTHEEYSQLALLNDLRAQGHTCPNGMVFPPNPVPLVWNCALWRASRYHVTDMTENDFFDHAGSDGSSPYDRVNMFGASFSNENIAAGKESAADSFQQWIDSRSGHCQGMMNPLHRSIGAAYEFDPTTTYWSYWTQMTSKDLPDASTQDCLNDDGTLPEPEPTPPPTGFPTVAGAAVATEELMNFEPTSFEMEVLTLINEARAAGNQEDCWGEFYTDLEPLEWNCGLFKSARHHLYDGKTNDVFSRTGSDGKTLEDRSLEYGVPHSCSDFQLTDGKDGADATPQRIVERMISCCCWAVFGPDYKSLGTGHASYDSVENRFPYNAWWVVFNRHVPPAEVQTCGGGDAPVPAPTPAPTETPTEVPTAEPTAAPVVAPTEAPAPFTCIDFEAKKECKKQADCCWKKSCKEKVQICPKQKTADKCSKFDCSWDEVAEVCGWVPAE